MARVDKQSEINELIRTADLHIAGGAVDRARPMVFKLSNTEIPRECLPGAAGLARRVGLPVVAIKMLNPIVRCAPRSAIKATDLERAEYGAALHAIGATWEADQVLRVVNPRVVPQALLYRAFGFFTQWNYQDAIPCLISYIESPGLDSYQRLVGQLNLVAAYVVEGKNTSMATMLQELRSQTNQQHSQRLYANSLELSAQFAISRGDWAQAAGYLSKAERLVSRDTLDHMFLLKWRAVSGLFQKRRNGLSSLKKVRKMASRFRHWETLRECDLFEAVATENEELLQRVYFGTPFSAYRQRMYGWLRRPLTLPDSYQWGRGERLDLRTGFLNEKSAGLTPGRSLHKLIWILSSDFYRPFRLATLHNHLYDGAFYDPVTAPTRVHQIVKRARKWAGKQGVGLFINEDQGLYWLRLHRLRLTLYREPVPASATQFRLREMYSRYGKSPFTLLQATIDFDISARTALRIVSEGIRGGVLRREGSGNATRYFFE